MNNYTIGSPVLIINHYDGIRTSSGLFGYVSRLNDDGTFWVNVLSSPTLDTDYDRRREERGELYTTLFKVKAESMRPLKGKSRLARVTRLKKLMDKEKDEEDPKLEALIAESCSPEAQAKRKAKQDAINEESARIGNVFKVTGAIERYRKGGYPAYHHPDNQAINRELMGYAQKGPSACTVTEMARWKQCHPALAQCSFWPDDSDVRQLVNELDLDPMTDYMDNALYQDMGTVFALCADLRRTVVKLLNKGFHIGHIDLAEDAHTLWSDYKKEPHKGYFIRFVKRRKLPV